MENVKLIAGTDQQIWEQIAQDLSLTDVYNYHVLIEEQNSQVELIIDIDLGGGFEGGFEMTTFIAQLSSASDFRFAIHKQDFFDEIGKFFGMQDVQVGDKDFDAHVLIKSNDEVRIRQLLSLDAVRNFFLSVKDDFTFGITHHNNGRQLELSVERGIVDVEELRRFYDRFFFVLHAIDDRPAIIPQT